MVRQTNIYVIKELQQKQQRENHHHNKRDKHDHRDHEVWGSSSVEPITWGQAVQPNHDEALRLWNNLPKDTGLQEEETQITHDHETSHQQEEQNSGEQNEEYKEDPFYYNPKLTNLQPDSTSIAHEDRDDEQ